MIGTGFGRSRVGWAAACLALALPGCVPLPFLHAPEVRGRVVDAKSGAPIADAIVVVRVDSRYDERLPDRTVLAHLEAVTDVDGRFVAGPMWKPGLSAWPIARTEVRLLAVMRDGYRCALPRTLEPSRGASISMAPAADLEDRRASCRPVSARPQEAPRYLAAWNALFPPGVSPEAREREQQLSRLLEARASFGFGENCEGPVTDLALAPGGARAAYVDASAGVLEVVSLTQRAHRVARVALPPPADDGRAVDTRRLAWTGPGELVLWEPAGRFDRSRSLSVLAVTGAPPQVVWRASGSTAAPAGAQASADPARRPLDPADLNDEGDALWLGRVFALRPGLDPVTGLGRDRLHITEADGQTREIALPGEACAPRGQFGRPHYRIAADTRTALDLRHVRGACHAVAIDLETGAWDVLDQATGAGLCREVLRVPASQLREALRGYTRELESALREVGADPEAAFSIELDAAGGATAVSRDYAGEARRAALPAFPLATPLRRIEVTVLGGGGAPPPTAAAGDPDAIEPL